MAKDIEAALCSSQDAVKEEVTHSVQKYITNYLTNYSKDFSAEATELVEAIADYGHYTQLFLSEYRGWTIGTDYPEISAFHVISDGDVEEVKTAVEGYSLRKIFTKAVNNVEDHPENLFANVALSLNLDYETSIYLYVTPTGDFEDVLGRVDGEDTDPELQEDNTYMIKTAGIPAHELGKEFRIVYYEYDKNLDNGNLYTRNSLQAYCSALAYANTAINSESAPFYTDNCKKAMTALYRYYDRTIKYREAEERAAEEAKLNAYDLTDALAYSTTLTEAAPYKMLLGGNEVDWEFSSASEITMLIYNSKDRGKVLVLFMGDSNPFIAIYDNNTGIYTDTNEYYTVKFTLSGTTLQDAMNNNADILTFTETLTPRETLKTILDAGVDLPK